MIKLKTAVLLGFCLEFGAVLAGASDGDCKALREFGTSIGIGFQLKDDLLDAYGDPNKFGKQVGGDIIANKKTFLLVKAIEMASGKNKSELNGWLQTTSFQSDEKVKAVKSIYDSLGIPAVTEKKIDHYFKKGFKQLERVSSNPQKLGDIRSFTENLVSRQS